MTTEEENLCNQIKYLQRENTIMLESMDELLRENKGLRETVDQLRKQLDAVAEDYRKMGP